MLVLGTAQLGLSYGISNKAGQPDQVVATEIIREAWENGIREFDTAQGYGESERILGKSLFQLKLSKEAKVITKFNPLLDHLNTDLLEKTVEESLKSLGVPQLYGMMLHREEMLPLWDKGLAENLSRLVTKGMVRKFGVSVYSPDKAIEALNTEGIDMVQVPTNILDRRFENADVFKLAKENRKQIYIRSVFLQGALLMSREEAMVKLNILEPIIEKLDFLAMEMQMTRREIALAYVKSISNEGVIFGAETPAQVRENCTSWMKDQPPSLILNIKKCFTDIDQRILDPTLWPKITGRSDFRSSESGI